MHPQFDEITDGLSNTIALGEIGNVSGKSLAGQIAMRQPTSVLDAPKLCQGVAHQRRQDEYDSRVTLSADGRGARWTDGAAGYSLFNTILPPNSPSCAVGSNLAVDGIYSAGSFHQGGLNVVFADGAVRFIADTIDVGDLSHRLESYNSETVKQPSPFGVWGALGTSHAGEEVTDF